jgi:hypothetical protein
LLLSDECYAPLRKSAYGKRILGNLSEIDNFNHLSIRVLKVEQQLSIGHHLVHTNLFLSKFMVEKYQKVKYFILIAQCNK